MSQDRSLTVTGHTRVVGLLGWPVSHSMSPVLHNAAATAAGLDLVYVPFPVEPSRLTDAVRGLPALGIIGVNVTIPHKSAILPLLDEVEPAAEAIGAVNTVVVHRDHLSGFNTDWSGFLADLDEKRIEVSGRHALVLGAGGSARAVVYALRQRGATVTVLARRPAQAEQLVASLGPERIAWRALNELSGLPAASLLVNTTPAGMAPHIDQVPWPAEAPWPGSPVVYDLIYNPGETLLMRRARDAGLRAENGLGMLVHQAAQAFSRWTGKSPSWQVMAAAAAEVAGQNR